MELVVTLVLGCLPLTLSQTPCIVYKHIRYGGLAADCDHRNLRSVPLDLPTSIVALSLVDNNISLLPNNVIARYKLLKNLDLSQNAISFFENGTFNNLSNLETLWLQRNRFRFVSENFPSDVFRPLIHLQGLDLHTDIPYNVYDEYSDGVFRFLSHLDTLTISAWPVAKYRDGFSYLLSLHSLKIVGNYHANLANIDNSTFEVLKDMPLLNLELSSTGSSMDTGAFLFFPMLRNLKLATSYDGRVSLSDVTACFRPFAGRNMTLLDLTGLQNLRDSRFVDHELTVTTMKFLLDICLESLILRNNMINAVGSGVISSVLFRCLKHLDLSHNHITGQRIVMFELQFMTNLVSMDISFSRNRFLHSDTLRRIEVPLNFSCPPNLQEVILRSGAMFGASTLNITLNGCTNVHYVDISECGTVELTGHITGLTGLKKLDISGDVVSGSVFELTDFWESLETLNMSRSHQLFDVFSFKPFYEMNQLQSLDLSLMNLQFVTSDYITRLKKLDFLSLRGNKFDTIPKEITNMVSLRRLDMSSNSLRTLDQETRDQLEKHLHDVGHFELLLSGNVFLCSCNTLDFISWLAGTEIVLDRDGSYACLTESGEMTSTQIFYKDFLHQWRRCIGAKLFMCTVIIFSLTSALLTATYICQKYHPVLEHIFLNWLGYQLHDPLKRSDFEFDAYICYGSSDHHWPCHQLVKQFQRIDRNLRLFVPDRDEIPGDSRAESIVNAISASWKVVVVMSENSFQDEWFLYSLLSAVRLFSSTNCITGRILLVYREDSPVLKAAVPGFLLNVLQHDHTLTAPDTPAEWIHLHQLLLEETFI